MVRQVLMASSRERGCLEFLERVMMVRPGRGGMESAVFRPMMRMFPIVLSLNIFSSCLEFQGSLLLRPIPFCLVMHRMTWRKGSQVWLRGMDIVCVFNLFNLFIFQFKIN